MLKTKIVPVVIVAIAIFSAVTLCGMRNEDMSALEAARTGSSAQFIESGTGVTRYQVFGEKNVPTIVLIHSFNGFLESWQPNVDALYVRCPDGTLVELCTPIVA